ncbi:MAG TPA: GNAT family N-acetyltransferase [Chloroflexota bacterium]|nr:GNAT family N-acetyltransferase [Chloroflexota bacterium]
MQRPTIHGTKTTLRPASPDDLDLLVRWFADPGVHQYWDGSAKSPEQIVRQGYTGTQRPEKEPFIVEAAGAPVGYVQYYVTDATSGGIDMFLIPSARDRGLGPDAAQALVRYLIEERGWRRVIVDPAADNARAVRAWEKAGFVLEREWPDHPDGPAVLMAIEVQAEGI